MLSSVHWALDSKIQMSQTELIDTLSEQGIILVGFIWLKEPNNNKKNAVTDEQLSWVKRSIVMFVDEVSELYWVWSAQRIDLCQELIP